MKGSWVNSLSRDAEFNRNLVTWNPVDPQRADCERRIRILTQLCHVGPLGPNLGHTDLASVAHFAPDPSVIYNDLPFMLLN